ncbi:hypothetical protein ACOME3_001860 [Neoechinorhynchus agilis]
MEGSLFCPLWGRDVWSARHSAPGSLEEIENRRLKSSPSTKYLAGSTTRQCCQRDGDGRGRTKAGIRREMIKHRSGKIRPASHAGTWYPSDPVVLEQELDLYLSDGILKEKSPLTRVIISPHAGIAYSGRTAGYAYKQLTSCVDRIKTIFILGPSHTYYFNGIHVSQFEACDTPLGRLQIDQKIIKNLLDSKFVDQIPKNDDIREHSLEMQFPFIARIFSGRDVAIVPILIGDFIRSMKSVNETNKVKNDLDVFVPYISDPSVLFIISTDFCHWGDRFDFKYHYQPKLPIYKSIEALDHRGMELISRLDYAKFIQYIEETKNTICGRNPLIAIMLLLSCVNEQNGSVSTQIQFEFVHYSQSEQITQPSDSSVSYASGFSAF